MEEFLEGRRHYNGVKWQMTQSLKVESILTFITVQLQANPTIKMAAKNSSWSGRLTNSARPSQPKLT